MNALNSVRNYVYSMDRSTMVGVALLVGAISYPLIMKIISVAIDAFAKFLEWFNERTIVVRLKSLNCDECAQEHKGHVD